MKKLFATLLLAVLLSGCFLDDLIGTNGDNDPAPIAEPNPPVENK